MPHLCIVVVCDMMDYSVTSPDPADSTASQKSLSREHSVEVIHLDVLRTFPTLGFFQEVGTHNIPSVLDLREMTFYP